MFMSTSLTHAAKSLRHRPHKTASPWFLSLGMTAEAASNPGPDISVTQQPQEMSTADPADPAERAAN
jgi:hypothetical protein